MPGFIGGNGDGNGNGEGGGPGGGNQGLGHVWYTDVSQNEWINAFPGAGLCVYGHHPLAAADSPFEYSYRFIPFLDVDVPLYVVGWAYDGQCAHSYYLRDEEEADRIFGGMLVHRQVVMPGQSSFSVPLNISPEGWGISTNIGYVLSNVRIEGTGPLKRQVLFDPVPQMMEVEFSYRPAPVNPDDVGYLPVLLRSVFRLGCPYVVGVRVPGGGRASASDGDWVVRARAEGRLYNGARVLVLHDRVEVHVPNRPVRSYVRNSDILSFFHRIEEVEFVRASGPVDWPYGLDVVLQGGYSAPLQGATLVALANVWQPEVPGVVLVPSMGLTPACQSAAAAFASAMESAHCAVVFCSSSQNLSEVDG